jgi:aminoglycoside phosphotransferase (APT) family kinase protein
LQQNSSRKADRKSSHPRNFLPFQTSGLSHHGVVRHLLRRKLITTGDVVDGNVAVKNVSRRNLVYAITREQGECYLLKQGIGRERTARIEREASVYEQLGRTPSTKNFANYLPRFYGYDPHERVLLVEYLKNGEDLRSYCTKHRRLPARIGAELGRTLATLHRTKWSNDGIADHRLDSGRKQPWVLRQIRPDLKTLRASSTGTIELYKVLQGFRGFRKHFDRLREEWRAESFIHSDLRWDNCIIIPRVRSSIADGNTGLKIVDWEMAGRGDPRWDVGAVFANFLSFWLGGFPITGDTPPEQYLPVAEMPLERLQPALRAFWSSYVRKMGLSQTAADAWLLRSVEYGGAQLVQTAFEQIRELADLAGVIVCQMQVSLNLLEQPERAATQLLGIPA